MTQASGSIAGVTYGRAKGGILYRRARAIPVNPATSFQTQVRDSLTSLVNRWTETLTAPQRTAWDTYGANVPVTDSLGSPITLSGQNWYIACNTPRLQSDAKVSSTIGVQDDAPTMYDRGDFTTPTGSLSASTGLSVTFTDTDAWANEDGGAMYIYMGRPRNASRNFFKGPYRLLGGIEGATPTPPTTPFAVLAALVAIIGYPLVEDQRVTLAVSVSRADGRLTTRREIFDGLVTS